MLTGCDYDPTFCDTGQRQMTTTAYLMIAILIVSLFLITWIAGEVRDYRKRRQDRADRYPQSWLD